MFARFRRDEGGASAAEFALVAPLLFTLLFGLFQFGWALHCASSVRYALEDSSRLIAVDDDVTAGEVETALRARLARLADAEIDITVSETTGTGVAYTLVETTYQHDMVVPFLGEFAIPFEAEVRVAQPT